MDIKHYDAIVVGAGILGTFHAYALAKRNKRVLVLEKDPVAREATVRNFGQVVPSGFPVGRWNSFGRYSTELYKELQSKKDIGIHANGSLYIASDESEMQLLVELQETFSATDYHSNLMTKQEVLDYSPNFSSDYVVGGLYFPQEVSAESRRLISEIQQHMQEQLQVTFLFNQAVTEVYSNGDLTYAKTANQQSFSAEKIFICNGRDFQFLYPDIFRENEIEISKLQMLVSEPVDFDLKGNILTGMTIRRYESFKSLPSYAKLNPANAHPELAEKGIHVLFKQRPDRSIVIGDSHVYADLKTGFDAGFEEDERINQLIINEAKRILNYDQLKIRATWSGFYSQMKDHRDLLELDVEPNIHIITGIGGKGMTASAGYAEEHIRKLYD